MNVKRRFYFLKIGLERATKSGKFVKENKSMTPILGINTVAVIRSCFRLQNTLREFIIDNFAQRESARHKVRGQIKLPSYELNHSLFILSVVILD